MIKVNKSSVVPASLTTGTVAQKRIELIEKNHYIDSYEYNNCYQQDDVITALQLLYRQKCAYCEKKMITVDIAHFRPRNLYPWLAYSWDNLTCICSQCAKYQQNHFAIAGEKIIFEQSHLDNIHHLSDLYDAEERPVAVNPEKEDVSDLLSYGDYGGVYSSNSRVQYTIDLFLLKRLSDERKHIFDSIKEEINNILISYPDKKDILVQLSFLIKKYKKEMDNEYTEFRLYRIKMFPHLITLIKQALLS